MSIIHPFRSTLINASLARRALPSQRPTIWKTECDPHCASPEARLVKAGEVG
jgi:hypothetical protein